MENIDKISIDDIRNLSDNIKIEAKGVSPEKLIELNNRLFYLDLLVTISIDMRISSDETRIAGLNVLELLPNVQRLKLNAVLTEPVTEIKVFKSLFKLYELTIYGYFKKNLSLEPIEHLNLRDLNLENGLSKKQQLIIEKFNNLNSLSVSDLNLDSFPINENVKRLRIYKRLLNSQNIFRNFPNISTLDLENCKEIVEFSFIANIENLQNITFRNMKNLEKFPKVHKHAKINSISLINLPNLSDINLLWQNDYLTEFMATGITSLNIEDFYGLKKLKSLKTVYITFKDVKESKKAEEFILENNWKYRQPGI